MAVEDKYKMLQNMKKGTNLNGGTFGGNAPDREPSPQMLPGSLEIQEHKKTSTRYAPGRQRFPHSQNDPILIRGAQNVDFNHMVIRKKEL